MKKENNKSRKKSENSGFRVFSDYIKNNTPKIILYMITLAVLSVFAFIHVATTTTVSSFSIADYEVGQIADKTVVASKTIPADYDSPFTVEKGETVIKKGFAITDEGYAKLKKMAESSAYIDYRAFLDTVVYFMILEAMFLLLFSKTCLKRNVESKELVLSSVFLVLIYAFAVVASKVPLFSTNFGMGTILPSSLFAYLITILFGPLDAVFFSIIQSFIVLNAAGYKVIPFLFALSTSLSATRIVCKIERRIDMVYASILQSIINVVFVMIFKLIFNDSLNTVVLVVAGVAFNGFISGILALGFITPMELLLNTSSVFRLMDLSDLNNPVMKKMLVSASGTYNHSILVASLAEAACREIGANSLMARVAAYYHDIGKMDNPEYYVENQTGGHNIHKEINPSLSVSIIKSHVKKGIEKGRSMRLPAEVIKIISEHHGNQVISFFYNEAKKTDPNASPEDYSYIGNPPSTKESAVVMLADTVEAACRTLEKPSVRRLEKFIDTLVSAKIDNNQLDNCNLTFKDLDVIKETFVQILAGYYHSRIEYPDQKDPDDNTPVLSDKTLSEAKGEFIEPAKKEKTDGK